MKKKPPDNRPSWSLGSNLTYYLLIFDPTFMSLPFLAFAYPANQSSKPVRCPQANFYLANLCALRAVGCSAGSKAGYLQGALPLPSKS